MVLVRHENTLDIGELMSCGEDFWWYSDEAKQMKIEKE